MKGRPILFSGPMVRAISEGRKTHTRRIIKPQPDTIRSGKPFTVGGLPTSPIICPYGRPGDRLWVRENFWQAGDYHATYPDDDQGAWFGSRRVFYSADGTPPNEPNNHYPNGLRNGKYSAAEPNRIWRSRPSIHMPRWASRITLEITDVRVEQLQDISEEDAKSEGINCYQFYPDDGWPLCNGYTHVPDDGECGLHDTAVSAFGKLWESINSENSWSLNPWVWVVEFKRIEK